MKIEDILRKHWKISSPAIFLFIVLMLVAIFSTAGDRVDHRKWLEFYGAFEELSEGKSISSQAITEGTTKTFDFMVPLNATKVSVVVSLTENEKGGFRSPDVYSVSINGPGGFSGSKDVSVSDSEKVDFSFDITSPPQDTPKYSYDSVIIDTLADSVSSKGQGKWTVTINLKQAGRFGTEDIPDLPVENNGVVYNKFIDEINIIGKNLDERSNVFNPINNEEGLLRDNSGEYSANADYSYYTGKVVSEPRG